MEEATGGLVCLLQPQSGQLGQVAHSIVVLVVAAPSIPPRGKSSRLIEVDLLAAASDFWSLFARIIAGLWQWIWISLKLRAHTLFKVNIDSRIVPVSSFLPPPPSETTFSTATADKQSRPHLLPDSGRNQ